MLPVLFTINNVSVTTMTIFLYLAFFVSLFTIWRITRYYEMDSETVLDLFLITSLVGLIGARLYFVAFKLNIFDDLLKVVNIFKYPGYSFWGGLILGLFAFWYLCRYFKLNFWKIADFSIVGLIIGMSVSSFGCLLGGCQYGKVSNSIFAVEQAGLIGKRFPVQAVEGVLLLLAFFYLSRIIYKYYPEGSIAAKGLLIVGFLKLILEQFRGEVQTIPGFGHSLGSVFSVFIVFIGIFALYKSRRKTIFDDLKSIFKFIFNGRRRKMVISNISKNWYNFSINFKFRISRLRKDIFKLLHVKANPREFQQN